jgi:COMPASS component SDC1
MSQGDTPALNLQEQTSSSISAAAHAYQIAMQQQSSTPVGATTPVAQPVEPTKDVVMTDGTPEGPAVSFFKRFVS